MTFGRLSFHTECEACQKYPVSVATSPHCAITQGHRALCHRCSQQLFSQDGATTTTNHSATTHTNAPLNANNDTSDKQEGHDDDDGDDTTTEERAAIINVSAADPTNVATSTIHTHKMAAPLVLPYTVWRNQVSLSTAIKIRDPTY